MSVKLRLAKTGKTHRVSYRIVAQDTKSKRDGKFLEILGHFLPYIKNSKNFNLKRERLNYWIARGAKPTLAVEKLLKEKDGKSS